MPSPFVCTTNFLPFFVVILLCFCCIDSFLYLPSIRQLNRIFSWFALASILILLPQHYTHRTVTVREIMAVFLPITLCKGGSCKSNV